MSYSFWRPSTLAPVGACPSDPPSYATDSIKYWFGRFTIELIFLLQFNLDRKTSLPRRLLTVSVGCV